MSTERLACHDGELGQPCLNEATHIIRHKKMPGRRFLACDAHASKFLRYPDTFTCEPITQENAHAQT